MVYLNAMTREAASQPDKQCAVYQSLASVAQALASPNRLQLLEHLAQGERSVEPLAAITGLRLANASQHLHALRKAGLVVARKEGPRVIYSIAGPEVVQLCMAAAARGRNSSRGGGARGARFSRGSLQPRAYQCRESA